MRVERLLWLLCVAFVALQAADAALTWHALSTFPHFYEVNPLLASLFGEVGTKLALLAKVAIAAVPATLFASYGTLTTNQQGKRASLYALITGVVLMVGIVVWNALLIAKLGYGWL